ncbi:MAG: DUF2298 domain-containing protein [Chloroflexota bacterium]
MTPPRLQMRLRRSGGSVLLLVLLLCAAALRLYNLNWDDFRLLHPDERAIVMFAAPLALPADWRAFLDPKSSPLNPHFFAYGSFTIYLLKLASIVAGWLEPLWGRFEYMALVGRVISTCFDLGTMVLVYLLGSRLYGPAAGLLAAAFVAVTTLHVQLSHFYAADTPLTFALLLALLLADTLRRTGSARVACALGAALGLALSFKFSALPALVLPPVALALRLIWPAPGETGWRRPRGVDINRAVGLTVLAVATAAALALILQPYALLDFATYSKQVVEQNAMVRGQSDLPYTRQYAGTPPYLYFLSNLVLWGYGPPLALAALGGWIYVMVRQFRNPRPGDLLLLAWVVPYFLITGSFYAKFMRYLLPIMPVLSLFAAVAVIDLYAWLRARGGGKARWAKLASPRWALALGAVALLGGAAQTAAFMNVYVGEHPRIAASRYIYDSVRPGAVLTAEHWDDSLPLPLLRNGQAFSAEIYTIAELPLYDDDTEAKLRDLIATLRRADYVVLSSNRLYGSIPRLPQRYPVTTRYYQLLFAGQLGFQLEREFTNYPTLGPWRLIDDGADESFTVYDHPKVLIFRKQTTLAESQLRALLAAPGGTPAAVVAPRLLSPAQEEGLRTGGTYAELFSLDGWQSELPILAWALALLALGLAGLPLAVAVFRWLPDRGLHFARPLSLLLIAWLEWQLASAGLWRAGPSTLRLLLAGLLLLAALLAWQQRALLLDLWQQRRGSWLLGEAVFWGVFCIFLVLRWQNPDLWHPGRGGEKPMDLAFLVAVAKSETFPPYDPWFAGGYINYYYFGQVLVAALLKLTGVAPVVGYNLAVPFLAAATAAGVFSVAYNLATRLLPAGERPRLFAGLLAVPLVVFAGNLGGAGQLVEALSLAGYRGVQSALPLVSGAVGAVAGLASLWWKGLALPAGPDFYWATSRVYPGASINEFPFFTFLFADLHAHMVALPFTLVALGVCLNLALSGEGLWPSGRRDRAAWVAAMGRWFISALVLGSLWPTNSWDFPTYAALAVFALFVVWYRGARSRARLFGLAFDALALVSLALILYLPFQAHYQSFYFGLDPAPDRSPLHLFFVVNGIFLFSLLSLLAYELWRRHAGTGWWRATALAARRWPRAGRLAHLYARLVRRDDEMGLLGLYSLLGLAVAGLGLHLVGHTTSAFLLICLAGAAWLALGPARSAAETFFFGLVGLGFALCLFCEFFAIKGDVGRMNTVFKFYLQVWVIWGAASAVAVAALWRQSAAPPGGDLAGGLRVAAGGGASLPSRTHAHPAGRPLRCCAEPRPGRLRLHGERDLQ